MTGDFDADEFEDEYQIELRQLIEAKLEAGEAVDTAATFGEAESEEPDRGKVIDLMDALKRSIDKGAKDTESGSRSERGSGPAAKKSGGQQAGGKKPSGTKAAGTKKATGTKKSASAKKTASEKKAPAKKTAERKEA